ncbi:MAG: hypothetical protein JKY89_07580 [Immundisolibacteraceae bacterium]|nr:hypothetical protein [Immundisolibacteraceae bacterium]
MKFIFRLGTLAVLALIVTGLISSYSGETLSSWFSNMTSSAPEPTFNSRDFGIATTVRKYRWKDDDGQWQLSDEAPVGESMEVYALEHGAGPVPSVVNAPEADSGILSQQNAGLLSELPDLLNRATQVTQQINAQRAMEEKVLSGLSGRK